MFLIVLRELVEYYEQSTRLATQKGSTLAESQKTNIMSAQYQKFFADRLTEEVKKVHGDGSSYDENNPQLDWASDSKQFITQAAQKVASEAINNVSLCFEKVSKHNNNVHPVTDELKRHMLEFVDAVPESILLANAMPPSGVTRLMQNQKAAKKRHERLKAFEKEEDEAARKRNEEIEELNRKCAKYREGVAATNAFLDKICDFLILHVGKLAQHPSAETKIELLYSRRPANNMQIVTAREYEGYEYWSRSHGFAIGALTAANRGGNNSVQRGLDWVQWRREAHPHHHDCNDSCWHDPRQAWAELLPRFLSALDSAGYTAFAEQNSTSTADNPSGKITIVL